MPDAKELPKAYDASSVEDQIYKDWEASGAFNPDKLPGDRTEPYCIVMPPPNRTGILHIGHAVMLAIEDLLIRFHRMRGKKTLWVPGTDHAAISTQVKVEQMLIEQGMDDPRKELGRGKFLERVAAYAEESKNTINKQIRKMGSSCDWSRERYTLDQDRSRAVNAVFKMMFDDGIIERGYRIVNWDPQFQTTLSDDEVEHKQGTARFVTFKYDENFPFAISTTRTETKFGDTAVAVHPDDERYKQFVGKTFEPVFCGKKLRVKVIADPVVDPDFGTGALGVTPAHSMIDADLAERHGLETVIVIGKDGRMTGEAGPEFQGLTTVEARNKAEKMLEAKGLLIKAEEIEQSIPVAQRGGASVEQLPMRQWFVRVNKPFKLKKEALKWKAGEEVTLKQLMIEAVEGGHITICPDRFNKTYFHWINNLRDWCISRQIWFGHQIPVWYCHKCEEKALGRSFIEASKIDSTTVKKAASSWYELAKDEPGFGSSQFFSETYPDKCPHCGNDDLGGQIPFVRDPDTLDTWFSSGLWTFSALGWPGKEWESLRAFHPTSVLETGYDILFFWIARMILMTTYALGEVPFRDVYLHGLIRDEQGRKMSKSLGNVLDPLDLIPKYGTDAVRLSLIMGTTPGLDTKLSEEKIKDLRNFTNKLWNISRFILMQIGGGIASRTRRWAQGTGEDAAKTLADEWILGRLDEVTASITKKLEAYEFSSAGEELRDFTWGDLADWYLEIAKVEKGKEDILSHILETILKLWHPFMPFVTEHVWKTAGFEVQLIVSEWPFQSTGHRARGTGFEALRTLITDLRRLRSEQGIEAARKIEVAIVAQDSSLIQKNVEIVKHLARAESISFVQAIPEGWPTAVSGTMTVGLNVKGAADAKAEKAKMQKEIATVETYVSGLESQLSNDEFVSKAPARVVEGMRAKKNEGEAKLEALKGRIT
jgi:valyl-tRNA synthetase